MENVNSVAQCIPRAEAKASFFRMDRIHTICYKHSNMVIRLWRSRRSFPQSRSWRRKSLEQRNEVLERLKIVFCVYDYEVNLRDNDIYVSVVYRIDRSRFGACLTKRLTVQLTICLKVKYHRICHEIWRYVYKLIIVIQKIMHIAICYSILNNTSNTWWF